MSNLKEDVEEIKDLLQAGKRRKVKNFNQPFMSRVGKGALKRGYVTVQIVNENNTIDIKKVPIVDGTYKLTDTYHSLANEDILLFKGKPWVIQPKHLQNPWNPVKQSKETYGHSYLMARMKTDLIKSKMKMGGMLIIGLIVAAAAGYYFFFGGGGTPSG